MYNYQLTTWENLPKSDLNLIKITFDLNGNQKYVLMSDVSISAWSDRLAHEEEEGNSGETYLQFKHDVIVQVYSSIKKTT